MDKTKFDTGRMSDFVRMMVEFNPLNAGQFGPVAQEYADYLEAKKESRKMATATPIEVRVTHVHRVEKPIEASTLPNIKGPTRTVIDEEGNRFQIEYRGPITRVTVTLPNGLHAVGNAKLSDTDTYNKEFGTALASIRASQRVLRKYERWLSREGYRLNG